MSSSTELLNRIDTERVPHNYPVNRVSELIQRHAMFYASSFDDEHVTETESRILGGADQSLCETTETVEIPSKLPRVSDGRAMVIAQDYTHKVQQKIRYVRCKWVELEVIEGPLGFTSNPVVPVEWLRGLL